MKKSFCFLLLLSSSLAFSAVFPQEAELRNALENLEDHVYDGGAIFPNGEKYKAAQKKYYFDNLHSKYLKEAGKEVEVEWVVEQIKALLETQINDLGLENIVQLNHLDGSVLRRIQGLDGRQYFQQLFGILFLNERDKNDAETIWERIQDEVGQKIEAGVYAKKAKPKAKACAIL